jgi:tripartite-type tricarboxylate transporter receptor subunit TctC
MKSGATRMLAAVALACLSPACPAIAAAADAVYPARPVRMLIPFPAGGASDTIGRTLGEQLSLQLGQPVVMDNRPGAAGRLATEMLTQAQPDGYTLLVGGVGPISISPSLYRKLGYSERDFTPLTRVAEIINVMVVNPSSGAATVRQFIDWAKKRTTDVRYGSSGPGQLDHLAGEFFQRLAGVPLTHVPYKGGGPALVDLIAGDLHLMFSTYVVALPHVKTGRLRALAVTTLERQPLLPDLPTVAETLPGYGVSNWNGIFAPARTPRPIAERLTAEIRKALQAPDLKRRQAVAGIEPGASASSAEFVKFIRDDTAQWEKIVRAAGIQLE